MMLEALININQHAGNVFLRFEMFYLNKITNFNINYIFSSPF